MTQFAEQQISYRSTSLSMPSFCIIGVSKSSTCVSLVTNSWRFMFNKEAGCVAYFWEYAC